MCSECPEDVTPSVIAAIGAAIGLLLLLIACLFFNRRAPNGVLRPLINAAQNLVVIMMFPVDWPESVKTFQRIISGINLDFVQIASPACLGMPVSFYGRFISMIVISAAVIGAPWLISYLQHRRNAAKWVEAIKLRLRDTFLLVVLLHPTVSGQSFYHFRCRLVDDKWYLMADYSLECYDSAWYGMLAPVLLTVLGFALGMPLLFARLLWKRRSELQNPETKKLLGVLYLSYKPDLYWFESVTMIFKLALWATLVFFEHGSQFQLAMSAMLCFFQLGVHSHFKPYNAQFKNVLQYVSYILIAFASFSGLLLNYVALAVEHARVTLKDAEMTRLAAQEQVFKTITAVVIWSGVVLIILQVLRAAVRFFGKHGTAVRQLVSTAGQRVSRRLSRRWTSDNSFGDSTTAAAAAGAVVPQGAGEGSTALAPSSPPAQSGKGNLAWTDNPAMDLGVDRKSGDVVMLPGGRAPSADVDMSGPEEGVEMTVRAGGAVGQ